MLLARKTRLDSVGEPGAWATGAANSLGSVADAILLQQRQAGDSEAPYTLPKRAMLRVRVRNRVLKPRLQIKYPHVITCVLRRILWFLHDS